MIAFLPLWILGVPLVLALVDLVSTRSGAHHVDYDDAGATGRYSGVRGELRRGDEVPVVVNTTANTTREHPAVNVS